MLDHLLDWTTQLGAWTYVILFLGATLETAAFFGLIVPGGTLVVFGGFLASRGTLRLDVTMAVVAVGAALGDSIGYWLGRRLGRPWLLRYGRWLGVRAKHLDKAEAYFARHGGRTVFIGRFIGFLRAFAPFTAGASRMRYGQFLRYDLPGGILWAAGFVLLGYLVGASWQRAEKWVGRASVIVGAVVLLVLALGWLWRWLVRHEDDLKARWHKLLERPRVAGFRRRFAPQIEFLQDRLSPQGYLGLHLTVGGLIIIAAGWCFGGIVEDILTGDPLTVIDVQVAGWFHDHATPPVTEAALGITFFGSSLFITGASLVAALFLAWRRWWHRLLALVLTMGGGTLLLILLKAIFHRKRPVFADPLVTLPSYSFPSGHVMGSTLLCGSIAFIIAMSLPAWRWRVLSILTAFLFVQLIALTRIYLGLHFLSDVLGAMTAGLVWLTFCLTAVETFRRRPKNPPGA